MVTPQELVETALDSSTADDCVVVLGVSSTANLRWANNTLTTNGVMAGNSITVVSVADGGEGAAAGVLTRTAPSTSQVKALVAEADAAARSSGPAEDAAEVAGGEETADWSSPAGQTLTAVLADFASDLGQSLEQATAQDHLLYGYVEQDVTTTYVGTSRGLRLRFEQPTSHVGITGKTADRSASAWVGQAAESIAEMSVPDLDAELERRLGWAARRIDLPAGRYDTLLPPTAVADLAIYAYWVSSARDAHEGHTVYSDPNGGTRVGQRIAKESVHVRSDPGAAGLATAPFVSARASSSAQSVFDNGLSVGATEWISAGTLRALGSSRHTATLTGLPFTPYVDNLLVSVDGGSGGIDQLVGSADRSLLLTCLWYIREVDPQTLLLTGLTRDGVYLVENGEVVGAVNNFRFNESPIDLLNRFTAAGESVRSFSREWGDYFPRTQTPALRVPDFNMSSVSQAS